MKSVKESLPRQEIVTISPKVIMPKHISDQIDYLHSKIGNVEWSGPLFYRVDGTIKDPKNLVITLVEILPMHKGTSGYTEYTSDETVMDKWMDVGLDCKIGHIHTHHNMSTFFSGTDWSELEDNAPNHNYYLSLITNHKREDIAKLCYIGQVNNSITALDDNGEKYTQESSTEKLVVMDCVIVKETEEISVTEEFIKQVDKVITKATTLTTTYYGRSYTTPSSSYTKGGKFRGYSNPKKTTTKGEFFEDEWEQFQEVSRPHYLDNKKTIDLKDILYGNITIDDAEDFTLDLLKLNHESVDHMEKMGDIISYYALYNLSEKDIKEAVIKQSLEIFKYSLMHCSVTDKSVLEFEQVLIYARDAIQAESSVEITHNKRKIYDAFVEGIQSVLNVLNLN